MAISIKLEGLNAEQVAKRIFNNDHVGLFAAQSAYRYMIPYIPMDTGTLYESADIKPFGIEFYQPYAHKQYTGDNFHFRHDKHPLATSHWDEAMMDANSKDLSREVERFIRDGL